ncbi:MAG: ABC transporter ATP-binding protein [Planctomycetes bacterium]|nr:ABC transporter ATP-binding protein [Planctomycetota bacterium]
MNDPILQFENVSAAHADGTPALRGVAFEIGGRAARAAVLGGNGAGKSSLFLTIAGFLAFEGSVNIFGEPLLKSSAESLRRKIGFVFENADDQLFLESVFEDIAFGPRNAGAREPEVRERVGAALAAVGLNGYETRHPRRLSQGERRLAAIATAIVMNPRLLVLDEPTANLDARARRRVLLCLKQFDGAVLLLTHDFDAAREITDRSIVLAEGRVVFDGATERAFSEPRARAALGVEDETFLDHV